LNAGGQVLIASSEQEAQLHPLCFRVMQDTSLGLDSGAAAQTAALLSSYLAVTAPSVPRRFTALKTLLVLGRALGPDAPLRKDLVALIAHYGLQQPPELPNGDALKLSRQNNHLLMQAAALLAWPEMDPDQDIARGLTHRFLAQMTADGVFPSEMCRGASCLWYANLAVMLLTGIAFSTRHQPEPLVSPNLLLQAIKGLNFALTYPPELRLLARRNLYAHAHHGHDVNRPNRDFLQDYHRSRHYLAWLPLARHLLPDEDLGMTIPADDQWPLCNDFIGGFSATLLAH
jgi:hypothetical protein